jgi:hypothetical protein
MVHALNNDSVAFDALLDAGREPLECPICTGCEDADPCSDDCAEIVIKAARLRGVARFYRACRLAMILARRYRAEEGVQGLRERAALAEVAANRQSIRVLRALNATDVDTVIDVALSDDMENAAQ